MTKAELALVDFQYFCEAYLGIKHYACQKVWADKTQAVIDGDHKGLQLLAPADHGKTSTVVAPAICWLLARDRDNRIGIGSSIDDYAQQIARVVMSYIERIPELERDFGLVKGSKWAVNEMQVARPNWKMKDPSLLAFGVGAEIQSQRFDYIFLDDGCTRRNSRTEAQRGALRSYIETDLGSRLDHIEGKGKTLIYGHRVEPSDYYSDNMDRAGWLYQIDRAIVDDGQQKVLCPEKWTYEALAEKRARDPIGFELLYQQQAASVGRFITRTAMERLRVPNLGFLQSMSADARAQYRYTWLELDPAFTVTRWSSYAVMQLWGITMEGRKRLLWGWRERVTPETLLPMMEMKFRLYMPDHFFIEGNAAQTMLVSHMRKKFPDHGSKFKAVTTLNKDGQLDEELQRLFERYNAEPPCVELPYKGPTEQAYIHALTEEFTGYPNVKSRDTLMATYVGEKGLGLLAAEERRGHMTARGITGAVANEYRNRFRFRR